MNFYFETPKQAELFHSYGYQVRFIIRLVQTHWEYSLVYLMKKLYGIHFEI